MQRSYDAAVWQPRPDRAGEANVLTATDDVRMNADRLVTVARYNSRGRAQLARAQLEEAGIRCLLSNQEQSGLAPMFDATEGGVQVKVPAERADAARSVLDRA